MVKLIPLDNAIPKLLVILFLIKLFVRINIFTWNIDFSRILKLVLFLT